MATIRKPLIRSHARRYWKSYILGSLMLIMTNVLHVFLPSFIGKAVDLLQGEFALHTLYRLCWIIIAIELCKGVGRFWMRYLIIGDSWKIENDIRKSLYRHLLTLPIPYFDRTRTGDIIARATNDLTAVRMMFGPAFMYALNAVVLLPLAVGFMLMQDVQLTLLALLPFPFIAIAMYLIGRNIHKYFVNVQESYSDISAHVQENLNGITVIKTYIRERHELKTLHDLSLKYVYANRNVIRLQSLLFPLLDVFASTGIIILLWAGGLKVIRGDTTIGTIISLVMYIGILIWPAMALGWVTALIQRGIASLRRIESIFDEKPEPALARKDFTPLTGHIDVRNLTFAFNEGSTILSDVSFTIDPGMTIAIVGRTGSGKSVLLGILSGIYQIPPGMVYFDGKDITDIPLEVIRSSIALTPQETFLFSDTIAENISFGKADADREHVTDAAKRAAIADEIDRFPQQYETMLGERGITVSGGQRQRIAIARALISDAPISFFDDSLSSVDTGTERIILANIKERIANKTALIVTQRLGAVKDADLILYLKHGHITEQGNHDTLMKLDGEYAALYKEQETIEALQNPDILL